jgi:hypothetical protein
MNNGNGVKIEKNSAKRLGVALRYVEQLKRNPVPALSGGVDFSSAWILLTNSIITRGTITSTTLTPGTGSGKIQKWNGTVFTDAGLSAFPILNTTTMQIATGAFVTCVSLNGKFCVINPAKCSDLS